MATNQNTTNGNKARPSHSVFHVAEREDGTRTWTPVGAAWPHKDGKGFNIRLESLPVRFDGQLTIRERKEEGEGR